MPSECTTVPQSCISIVLHDVHVGDINEEAAKNWLVEQLLERVVRLEIISKEGADSVNAYIYSEGRDHHVNDQLYEFFSSDETIVQPENVIAQQPVGVVKVGERLPATCYLVESSTVLKCQLQSFADDVNQVMNTLSEIGATLPSLDCICVGASGVAQFSEDQEWYRIRVLELKPDSVKCEFIDYGSVESLQPQNVKVLPDQFKTIPQTCLSVQLYDVHSEEIDTDATKKFLTETYLEQEVLLEIIECSQLPLVSANVYPKGESSQHVNDDIYNQFGLAGDETVVPGTSEPEDSGISVGIYYFLFMFFLDFIDDSRICSLC